MSDDGPDILPDLGTDFLQERTIERPITITARQHSRQRTILTRAMLKQERLEELLPRKPTPGWSHHLVSNGHYDFWTWIPVLTRMIRTADEFYGATWTLNVPSLKGLFDLFDRGQIRQASLVLGLDLKRRKPDVYGFMATGMMERRQRFCCLPIHAKVTLLANHQSQDFLVVEGSANFTGNPQIEQYCVTNDRGLFDFHRQWIEEVLTT